MPIRVNYLENSRDADVSGGNETVRLAFKFPTVFSKTALFLVCYPFREAAYRLQT